MLSSGIIALARKIAGKSTIPPGELVDIGLYEPSDRKVLIDFSKKYGDIFKINEEGRPQICLIGLKRSRQLLRNHAHQLRSVNIDLTSMFSSGFIRMMTGTTHEHYRNSLISALVGMDFDAARADFDLIASHAIDDYQKKSNNSEDSSILFREMLTEISSGFLLRLFFGFRPESDIFHLIHDGFCRLGPHGLVWNVSDVQKREFKKIRTILMAQIDNSAVPDNQNILSRVNSNSALDETMLGNLIYMIEIGRYDMAGLFSWIAKNAATSPIWVEKIKSTTDAEGARAMARAFVLETLRMDQSERLIREVTEDFSFGGFLFPKGWRVRICMWESHKDEISFPKPFEFDPSRFLSATPSANAYSPFGLDRHQCPFSTIAVNLGAIFLFSLVRHHRLVAVNNGPAVHGAYHWEPPIDFSVRIDADHTTD